MTTVNFSDLDLNQKIEVFSDKDSEGRLMLWDYLPSDVNLSELQTSTFEIVGLNFKLHSENSEACIMIQVSEDIGWNFLDSNEIDEWKGLGWKLSNKLDLDFFVLIISLKTVSKIKTFKGISLTKYGHFCIDCKDYFPYALSNTVDDRLVCYSCRTTHSWKYQNLKPTT
jgi:hypothetical protein